MPFLAQYRKEAVGFPGTLNMHGGCWSTQGRFVDSRLHVLPLPPADLWLVDEWDHRYHVLQQRKRRLVTLAESLAKVGLEFSSFPANPHPFPLAPP